MDSIDKLIRLQDVLIDQLSDVSINIKQEVESNRSLKLYEHRIQLLNELYEKFKENHYRISMADDANSTTEYFDQRKLSDFDKLHFDLINILEEKVASLSVAQGNNSADSTHITHLLPSHKSRVKLPPISLPKFDGTYKSWRSFRDLYVDLIHNNDEISDIEKLHYLKSCVSGEAARIIKPFEIVGSNYSKAWRLLEQRFNNNRVLINAQLEKLCKISPVKNENAQSMKDVLSNTEEILHELKTLKVNIDNWDPVIVYLTVQKLAPETRELWEIKQSEKVEVASFKELTIFLEARFRALEAINLPKRSNVFLTQNNKISTQIVRCPKCNSDHRLFNCTSFKSLSASEKLSFIKRNQLCMNCFTVGHKYSKCKSKYTCSTCKKKHNSLLHTSFNTIPNIKQNKSSAQLTHNDTGDKTSPVVDNNERKEIKTFFSSNTNQALLATALVKIRNTQGQNEIVRALIDSGSQATFITSAAAKRLQLKGRRTNQLISGLNQSSATVATSQTEFTLESICSTFNQKVNALVVRSITNDLPSYGIETSGFDHLKNLKLADPNFAEPGRIDMLIGAEVYAAIIRDGIKRSTKPDHPIAINTALGWIVMGSMNHANKQISKTFMVQVHEAKLLDEQLRNFWKQEEVENTVYQKPQDQKIEAIYSKTTKRSQKASESEKDLPLTRFVEQNQKGNKNKKSKSDNFVENKSKQDKNKRSKCLKKSKEKGDVIAKYVTLKCELCCEEFSTFNQIRQHLRTKHNKKGHVVCCNKKLHQKVVLFEHFNKHFNPEYFKCNDCYKIFSDRKCLRKHILVHKSNFICDQCHKRFPTEDLLIRHKLIHLPPEERQFTCNDCGKKFKTKYSLQTHHRYVHENTYGKLCHICAKVIRGGLMFEKHQREHAGIVEPKVQCEKCGTWLKNKSSLAGDHNKRLHSESSTIREYEKCGKVEPSKRPLKGHLKLIHESKRTYQCGICDNAF